MNKVKQNASRLFQRSALFAALTLSVFSSAQALTLNRPVVQSKQGEILRAEIDITDISSAELVDLQASLASQDIYKATQVEFPMSQGVPMEIDVQLMRRSNGKPYLKIRSKQTVNNNALDVLIDLRWATGRLLRDFSLSIDEAKATTPPISAPALSSNSRGQQISVQRGDTASELALNKMPDGVTLDQMLVALVRQNPDAFVDANVNRMKAGALLTLPTEQQAKAVSREEARREIQVQTKDFEAYRAELAARAPGGAAPKAARDSAGKLEANVQNKNTKAQQDKLTLAKPGSKDAKAEEKIAQQREAQDVAERAAELSRNMAELGKIAAATVAATPASTTASTPASGELPADLPASAATSDNWLDELTNNPMAPVGAGGLIALLVLFGLWRRRASQSADVSDIQGLPPLNVKFNLDLPEFDNKDPIERGYIHEVATHAHDTHDSHEQPHDQEPLEAQASRPTLDMPDISLDLEDAPRDSDVPSPYQVRIDLADELWNLGQMHTSRALMEEVANEASGDIQAQARQWLADRG